MNIYLREWVKQETIRNYAVKPRLEGNYSIYDAVQFLIHYSTDAKWDCVSRAMKIMERSFYG